MSKLFDKHVMVNDTFDTYIERNIDRISKRINSESFIQLASYYYNKYGVGCLDIFVNDISDIREFMIGESIFSDIFKHSYFVKEKAIGTPSFKLWEAKIENIAEDKKFDEKKHVLICFVKSEDNMIEILASMLCNVDTTVSTDIMTEEACLEMVRYKQNIFCRQMIKEVDDMIGW